MQKVIQQRVGHSGTCFRASLASVLEIPETQVPDFPEANCDPGVDEFLAPRGMRYEEYPITDPAPSGWHFILGTSPRGGQHCVVGLNGRLAHDPHPVSDDPRRGLVEPKSWGVLEPLGGQDRMTVSPVDGSLRYGDGGFKQWASKRNGTVRDALSGKRLNAAAERLYEKHDDIDGNLERQEWMRMSGPAVSAYAATHSDIVKLVAEAESLLAKAKLDDDHSYWQAKLQLAKSALRKAELLAKQGDYKLALATQEGAFTLAHAVIDKMRNSGRTRGRDTARAKDAKESKYIDGPNSAGEYSAGASIDGDTAQRAGFKTYSAASEWVRVMLQKMRKQKAQDSTPSTRRARLHRALDRVLGY